MSHAADVNRARTILAAGAEAAMTATDTERELARLHQRLPAARRARRMRLVGVAAAVAALASAAVALTLLTTHADGALPPAAATPPAVAQPDPIPGYFPVGFFARTKSTLHEMMRLTRDGHVYLRLDRGTETNVVAFPRPGVIVFTNVDSSGACPKFHPGRYRYDVTDTTIRFTLVHDPSCAARAAFFVGGVWHPTDTW